MVSLKINLEDFDLLSTDFFSFFTNNLHRKIKLFMSLFIIIFEFKNINPSDQLTSSIQLLFRIYSSSIQLVVKRFMQQSNRKVLSLFF